LIPELFRRALRGVAVPVAALGLAFVGVAPASAQELASYPGYPDLRVSAQLDKPAYDSGDVVRATVTITNAGDTAAQDVYVFEDWPFGLQLDSPGWGDLRYGEDPVRLDPGATITVDLTGTIWDPSSGTLHFGARFWSNPGDPSDGDNAFSLTAPVTPTYGDFGGTVIDDRNGNGEADPGEGLGGVQVFVRGGAPYRSYDQVTDRYGRFFFDDLPSGRYASSYYSEDGWVVGPEYPNEDIWTIGPTAAVDAVVAAVRPLSDKLLVTTGFTRDSYQVGDEAHAALTLRNKTGQTLTGIHAHCNGIGNSNQLNGVGAGWAAFDQSGPGVTLAAGETRTFDVYEAVPDGALEFGFVALDCEVGPGAGTGVRGLPYAVARAKVPGATTTVRAQIAHDANGDGWIATDEGIADTRVALLDYGTHTVAASGRSDAGGRFEFAGIPAGLYVLRVIGPWQPVGSSSIVIEARAGSGGYELVFGMEPRGNR